jgi:hypothetical protein
MVPHGVDGRGGGGRLKKTDVWVPHVSEVRGEGKPVHTEVRWTPIRLQVGHGRRLAYKMAYFKQVQNCNGTNAAN